MTRTAVLTRIGAVTALVAGSVLGTALPAQAADVGTIGDLQTAFSNPAETTVTLTGDISAPTAALTRPATPGDSVPVTLDLDGHELSVQYIDLLAGADVTITDSSGGAGSLTADASAVADQPGIRTTGAFLTIQGGTVTATGNGAAAGIGGGDGDAGGTVTIGGNSTVNATGTEAGAGIGGGNGGAGGTIAIGGASTVTATGVWGAGIGGGDGGAGGTIAIGETSTVTATGATGAGIGGGNMSAGGTITISGGTVDATAGSGAGIGGGGYGGSSGTITISGDSTVTAAASSGAGIGGGFQGAGGTITISGGTVDATAVYATGIGGGGSATDTTTLALTGGTTTARTNPGQDAVVGQWGSLSVGEDAILILDSDQTIPAGQTVSVDGTIQTNAALTIEGALTIEAGARITGTGTLVQAGDGTVTNNGAITLPTESITPPDREFVDVNNYEFVYIDQGTEVGTERVYAPTFSDGERTMLPGIWTTEPDGSGDRVTDGTDLTVGGGVITGQTTNLYRQTIESIAVTATPESVVQGGTVVLTATGTTPTGATIDVTEDVTFTTDQDDTVTDHAFTPTTLVDREVTATLNADPSITGTTTVAVTPAPLTSITVTADPNPVAEGEPVTLTVIGENQYGPVGDVTDQVVLTTDQRDTVTDGVFTPDTPVDRVVTATHGDVTAETTVTVLPVIASIEVTADPVTVDMGGSSVLKVVAYGTAGQPLGDVTELSTFTSDVATDVFDGNAVTFPTASPHTITATFNPGTGPLTDTVVIEVIPAPTPTPTPAPAPEPAGGDRLASTGTDPAAPAYTALALLLAGIAATRLRRRKRA